MYHIDLWILKNPCFPGINHTLSWCMILLMYCWISFASILVRVFAEQQFSSVQFSSVAQLCLTLCNPMDWRMPGFIRTDWFDLYFSLLLFGTLHSNGYIFPFLLCLLCLFFSQLFVRPPQTTILSFCIFFSWRCFLITASCTNGLLKEKVACLVWGIQLLRGFYLITTFPNLCYENYQT